MCYNFVMKSIIFIFLLSLLSCQKDYDKMYLINQRIEEVCYFDSNIIIITPKLKINLERFFLDYIFYNYKEIFKKNKIVDITIMYTDINNLRLSSLNDLSLNHKILLTRGNFLKKGCKQYE